MVSAQVQPFYTPSFDICTLHPIILLQDAQCILTVSTQRRQKIFQQYQVEFCNVDCLSKQHNTKCIKLLAHKSLSTRGRHSGCAVSDNKNVHPLNCSSRKELEHNLRHTLKIDCTAVDGFRFHLSVSSSVQNWKFPAN
jgi:hypothetical protein